jgi:hypothetical protein
MLAPEYADVNPLNPANMPERRPVYGSIDDNQFAYDDALWEKSQTILNREVMRYPDAISHAYDVAQAMGEPVKITLWDDDMGELDDIETVFPVRGVA